MGSFHPYPFLFRLADELAGLVGESTALALYHISDVNLAANKGSDGGFRPLVADVARISASLALIIERTG